MIMNPTNGDKKTKQNGKIYTLSRTAIIAAVICVLAPLSIPIGPIPVSLTTLVLYLSLYLVGWKLSTLSLITYLAIGMIGLPVFSGFSGGFGRILGPTGGYIVGFLPMVILSGLVIDKCSNRILQFVGLLAGTAVCYAFGTAWYCFEAGATLQAALAACVFPFIPVDLVKIAIAMFVGPQVRKKLVNAGLLES